MSDGKRRAERKRDRRGEVTERKLAAMTVSVDSYSLASQRRAIAYGRARGHS